MTTEDLRNELMTLLRGRSLCYVSTLMPDGSPQLTQVWVDTDGENIVINTVAGYQKLRNMERDPRVAIAVSDPGAPSRFVTVRGRVRGITKSGGEQHIEFLAHKYLGRPYPWYGGRDQTRVIVTIDIDKIHAEGG